MSNISFINKQISQLGITAQRICVSEELPELGKVSFQIVYRGRPFPAVLVRFKGAVYAYLNQCLYTCKPLDYQDENIFDETGRFLRSSPNGICYNPETGEGYSPICMGQTLTKFTVNEIEGAVYLQDKHAYLYDDRLTKFTINENSGSILLFQDEYSSICNSD